MGETECWIVESDFGHWTYLDEKVAEKSYQQELRRGGKPKQIRKVVLPYDPAEVKGIGGN